MAITLFNVVQYSAIKRAGRLAGQVLDHLCKIAKPGISTGHLDRVAEDWIRSHNAFPTFKGYKNGGSVGFPATICTSVNHEATHGIPSDDQILNDGDILKIDVGVTVKEEYKRKSWDYIGDTARTIPIGPVDPTLLKLINYTSLALSRGIDLSRVGNKVQDISTAIFTTAQEAGVNLIRDKGGHGIGPYYHSPPHIANSPYFITGLKDQNVVLRPGMLICVEPIFTLGSDDICQFSSNSWTTQTRDHCPASHFEHTILVTEEGPCVTTKV